MPLWLGLAAAVVLLGTSLLGSHLPAAPMAPVAAEAKTVTSPATAAAAATAAPVATAAVAVAATTPVAAPAATSIVAPAAPAMAAVAPAAVPATTTAATTTPAAAPATDAVKTDTTKVAQTAVPAVAASLPKPNVSVDELMAPGPLPDNVLGDAKAPVTIVEYASMTCPHCADFHMHTFPELKTKYIDTGKVRLVFREFPLDNMAAAVSELARCLGPMRYFAFIGTMFDHQAEWHTGDNDLPKLQEMAKQAGFTDDSFKKCVTDQALLDNIKAVRARADEKFHVDSTPTFFINGVKLTGGHEIKDFDDALAPFLKG